MPTLQPCGLFLCVFHGHPFAADTCSSLICEASFNWGYCLKVAVARPRWRVSLRPEMDYTTVYGCFGNFEQVQSYLETMGWKVSDKGELAMVLK
jgi:hypothetical protein